MLTAGAGAAATFIADPAGHPDRKARAVLLQSDESETSDDMLKPTEHATGASARMDRE